MRLLLSAPMQPKCFPAHSVSISIRVELVVVLEPTSNHHKANGWVEHCAEVFNLTI